MGERTETVGRKVPPKGVRKKSTLGDTSESTDDL